MIHFFMQYPKVSFFAYILFNFSYFQTTYQKFLSKSVRNITLQVIPKLSPPIWQKYTGGGGGR